MYTMHGCVVSWLTICACWSTNKPGLDFSQFFHCFFRFLLLVFRPVCCISVTPVAWCVVYIDVWRKHIWFCRALIFFRRTRKPRIHHGTRFKCCEYVRNWSSYTFGQHEKSQVRGRFGSKKGGFSESFITLHFCEDNFFWGASDCPPESIHPV